MPFVNLHYCNRLVKKTPIERTVMVMAELKAEGKIRHVGLCECSSDSLRRTFAVHPIAAVQIEYSPISLDIKSRQTGLLETCRELSVAVVAYSPVGRGMLAGAIRSPKDFEEGDAWKLMPRVSEENSPKNLELVKSLNAIARKKTVTPSQLTLA